jgi:hypothetical protein
MGLAYGVGIYYRRCKVAGTIKITRKVDIEIYPIEIKKKKKKKKKMLSVDISSAFTYGELEEEIYMR